MASQTNHVAKKGEMQMTKQEMAVLRALQANPAGLFEDDFREATKREVSRHTVGEHLAVLSNQGLIKPTAEQPRDGRIKGMLHRYTLTGVGLAFLAAETAQARQ